MLDNTHTHTHLYIIISVLKHLQFCRWKGGRSYPLSSQHHLCVHSRPQLVTEYTINLISVFTDCNVRICSDCLHKEGATCRRTCQWNEYPISVRCHSPYCQWVEYLSLYHPLSFCLSLSISISPKTAFAYFPRILRVVVRMRRPDSPPVTRTLSRSIRYLITVIYI